MQKQATPQHANTPAALPSPSVGDTVMDDDSNAIIDPDAEAQQRKHEDLTVQRYMKYDDPKLASLLSSARQHPLFEAYLLAVLQEEGITLNFGEQPVVDLSDFEIWLESEERVPTTPDMPAKEFLLQSTLLVSMQVTVGTYVPDAPDAPAAKATPPPPDAPATATPPLPDAPVVKATPPLPDAPVVKAAQHVPAPVVKATPPLPDAPVTATPPLPDAPVVKATPPVPAPVVKATPPLPDASVTATPPVPKTSAVNLPSPALPAPAPKQPGTEARQDPSAITFQPVTAEGLKAFWSAMRRKSTDDLSLQNEVKLEVPLPPVPVPQVLPSALPSAPSPAPPPPVPTPTPPKAATTPEPPTAPATPTPATPASTTSAPATPADTNTAEDARDARAAYMRFYRSIRSKNAPAEVTAFLNCI